MRMRGDPPSGLRSPTGPLLLEHFTAVMFVQAIGVEVQLPQGCRHGEKDWGTAVW